MRFSTNQGNTRIIVSIVLAMALRILPWSREYYVYNPDWILLIVIYWCLIAPERFNIGSTWCVGLLTDTLTGQLLGQYALTYSIIAYITVRLHKRIRVFPISQQILIILCMLLLSQLVIFWIKNIQSSIVINWTYWIPSYTGALLWPFVFVLLGGIHHKSNIR